LKVLIAREKPESRDMKGIVAPTSAGKHEQNREGVEVKNGWSCELEPQRKIAIKESINGKNRAESKMPRGGPQNKGQRSKKVREDTRVGVTSSNKQGSSYGRKVQETESEVQKHGSGKEESKMNRSRSDSEERGMRLRQKQIEDPMSEKQCDKSVMRSNGSRDITVRRSGRKVKQ